MSALPVAKLAALLVKQLAKPMANIAKERAKKSYFFRTCEVRLKMWVMNLGKAVEVPQLNEAMAIELGATLLSEFIIFTTGATLLVAEVVRRNKKESAQEQARLDQLQAMSDRINDLEIETMRQDAQLRELSRLCLALQSQQPEKGANQAQPANAEKTLLAAQRNDQPEEAAKGSSNKP